MITQEAATPATTKAPAKAAEPTIVDIVAGSIRKYIDRGELCLPNNYNVSNALKSAWLVLQSTVDKDGKPALEVCTRQSIANALLDMIVQGLNPMKKQNYFIVYGKTLTCQRSYFGSMAVAKMVQPKIDDFAFACVYEGDAFKYGIKNGRKIITEHEQDIQNINKKKIIAAYCIALNREGEPYRTEIMTIDEIHQAWKQSKMNPFDDKGNLKDFSTHGKFTGDMALKTVINKCCKAIINASSDNVLLLESMNRNDDLADRAETEAEIEENANTGKVLTIEKIHHEPEQEAEAVQVEQEQEKPAKQPEPWIEAESPKTQGRTPGF